MTLLLGTENQRYIHVVSQARQRRLAPYVALRIYITKCKGFLVCRCCSINQLFAAECLQPAQNAEKLLEGDPPPEWFWATRDGLRI